MTNIVPLSTHTCTRSFRVHASLMHIASGTLAFLLMAVLSADAGSASALLNPSAATNAELLAAGCSLIPSSAEVVRVARPYWLLSSATWTPLFATMGFTGFLAGVGRIEIFLIPGIIGLIVPISIWFGLKDNSFGMDPLTVLGIAYGIGPWLNAALCFGIVACSPALRAEHGLKWLLAGAGWEASLVQHVCRRCR